MDACIYDTGLDPFEWLRVLCDRIHGSLFIREFTNGWAVYNRSGSVQQVELPVESTGVHSGVTATQHTLADLDGEIYIKAGRTDR